MWTLYDLIYHVQRGPVLCRLDDFVVVTGSAWANFILEYVDGDMVLVVGHIYKAMGSDRRGW